MSDIIQSVPPNPTAPATEAAPVAAKPVAKPKKLFGLDERFIAPIFITLILAAAQYQFGVLESYSRTLLAILTSIATELILGRLFTGKWPHWASAYISGISIGILIRSPEMWPYALCAMISITSKYVIRINGRHLWNPSNLAICAMLLVAHDSVATLNHQWDNSIYAMLVIWALGSLIIARLKRFHICATYVVCFIGFAFLRACIIPHTSLWNSFLTEVAPITGPMYQLFIFFMITDPKTTVHSKKGQMLVAFLIAAFECALRLHGTLVGNFFAPHAPYYALTVMGPTANLIEIWKDSRKKKALAANSATI